MTARPVRLLSLVAAVACGASGAPPAETVTPVNISGPLGDIGEVEIYNAPGVGAHAVPLGAEDVWRVLPRVYAILGIPRPGGDAERRLFGAQGFEVKRIEGKRLSEYIDCGMGPTAVPKADDYEITMSVVTQLSDGENGATMVETVVQATGKPRAVSGNAVYCQSNGTLEARVTELVLRVVRSDR